MLANPPLERTAAAVYFFCGPSVACAPPRPLNGITSLLGGTALGADAFIAFYGLRYTLTDAEMAAVEQSSDERVVAAGRAKLQTYTGRLTDGQPYFLLVGTRLGVFGIQNESERSVDTSELEHIMRGTAEKLKAAGMPGAPQLHLQFEAQY